MTLKKTFTIAVVAASLFGGSLIAIPLLASAQDDSPSLESEVNQEDSTTNEKETNHRKRGPKRGAFIGEVLLEVGLDPVSVKEGFANGQTLGDTAEANGISPESIIDAIVAAMTERLNQAIADGKLTPEEAAEKAAGIPERANQIVDTIPERKDKEHRPKRGAFIGEVLLEVGLDPVSVKEGFANGQTLGDTAEANGISPESIIDAIVAAMTERLNQAIADGKLTPEEAAEKAAGIPERANEIVDTIPERKDKEHRPQSDGKKQQRQNNVST